MIYLFSVLFLFGIIVSSCKKVPGPQGETGAAGVQGNQGAQGIQGVQGNDGNANVKSYDITVPVSSFQKLTINNEYYASATLPVVVGLYDAVMVYKFKENVNGTDYYAQLPYDDWYNTSYYIHYFFEIGNSNSLFVSLQNSSGSAPFSNMTTGNIYYRVVIIKGTAGRKANIPDGLNTKDYNQVKKVFNLTD